MRCWSRSGKPAPLRSCRTTRPHRSTRSRSTAPWCSCTRDRSCIGGHPGHRSNHQSRCLPFQRGLRFRRAHPFRRRPCRPSPRSRRGRQIRSRPFHRLRFPPLRPGRLPCHRSRPRLLWLPPHARRRRLLLQFPVLRRRPLRSRHLARRSCFHLFHRRHRCPPPSHSRW
jgi:hypothetical protein